MQHSDRLRKHSSPLGPPCAQPCAVCTAFINPCMYCGLDDQEIPYEDTEEHRDTSAHQWTVYNS